MSFTALGVSQPDIVATTSVPGENCRGGQYSKPDGAACCRWKTWGNTTYGMVKGGRSLQYQNERRVREALKLLVAPTDSGFPSGLEEAAYDASSPTVAVGVDAGLIAGLERAAYNYYQLYPPERWYKKEKGVATECAADGYYSQWLTRRPPFTAARAAALQNVVGQPLDPVWLDKMKATGSWNASLAGAPAAVSAFQAAAVRQINSVPGSSGSYRVTASPERTDLIFQQGDEIAPLPWTYGWLQVFAPGWDRTAIVAQKLQPALKTFGRPAQRVPQLKAGPRSVLQQQLLQEEEIVDEERRGYGLYAAAGLGLLAVGAGAWLLSRKR